MKKLLMILIVLVLSSCSPQNKVTLMAPQGSPLMTVLGLDQDDYEIDVVSGADPLVAAFGSNSHDAILAPTNLGVKLYASKTDYKLAALVVFGNYHLVSTSFTEGKMTELQDKSIVVFGQNQTSDIIIKHLISELDLDVTIEYVDSVQLATSTYIFDSSKIVMVAEPSLSKIKSLVPETKSIDLQDEYAKVHEGLSYPQASLFVKSSLDSKIVERLIKNLKQSIDDLNDENDVLIRRGVELGITDSKEILKNAIKGSHLNLIEPKESRTSLDEYLDVILSLNPMLIGGKLPDESIYWSDQM